LIIANRLARADNAYAMLSPRFAAATRTTKRAVLTASHALE
jgi:hypothetical protein